MPPSLKCVIESAGQKAQFPPRWFASTYRRKLEVLVDRSSCLTLYQNVSAESMDFFDFGRGVARGKNCSAKKHCAISTHCFRRQQMRTGSGSPPSESPCRRTRNAAARLNARDSKMSLVSTQSPCPKAPAAPSVPVTATMARAIFAAPALDGSIWFA